MTEPTRMDDPTELECSPDGESRALLCRAGDLLPLNPLVHLSATTSGEPPSPLRP